MSRQISVEFSLELPCEATDKQVEEWLRFELGETCMIAAGNPLSNFDLRAATGSVSAHEPY